MRISIAFIKKKNINMNLNKNVQVNNLKNTSCFHENLIKKANYVEEDKSNYSINET